MSLEMTLFTQAVWVVWVVIGMIGLVKLALSVSPNPKATIGFGALAVIFLPPLGLLLLLALSLMPRTRKDES